MKNLEETIIDLKNAGKKVMGCLPLYTPYEIFHSMGFIPVTLWGLESLFETNKNADQHLQTFVCRIARDLTEFIASDHGRMLDGLFTYNACDTLRNMPEILNGIMEKIGRPIHWFSILPPPRQISDLIETTGMRVAANDIAALGRNHSDMKGKTIDRPEDYYVAFYRNHIPCPTLLSTADRRIEILSSLIKENEIKAMIFIGMKYCEYEYFEMPYIEKKLKEEAGIPTLLLEISDAEVNLGQMKTRIEAFAEMINTQ